MTAGYSGTPLLKKLGIKANSVVRIFDEPSGFRSLIDGDQTEVDWQPESTSCDVILVFAEWESRLLSHLESAIPSLRPNAGLWIAWPKRASGRETDLSDTVVREVVLPLGLVDNKVCAIDDTWSGLRVAWRRELRT